MARGRRRQPRSRPSPPVPFPWDSKSDQNRARIEANYRELRADVVEAALDGQRPTLAMVRQWHTRSLDGVPLSEPWVAGHFRGEGPPHSQLRSCQNHVAGHLGEAPNRVRQRVAETFAELARRCDDIETRMDASEGMATLYPDLLRLCAWVHGEWVRIHPFADHNGSTARLLSLMIGLRFGLPLNLPGKPRPKRSPFGIALSYDVAAANQMSGDDTAMVTYMHRLISQAPPSAAGLPD